MTNATVAVYRRSFLPPSETFVRDHLLGLTRYRPVAITTYVQPRGLDVPGVPLLVADDRSLLGRARRRLPQRVQEPRSRREERGLATALAKVRPDLVHAHFGLDGAVAVGALSRSALPLVVTFHGFDATTYPDHLRRTEIGRLLADRWEEVLDRSERIIAVSNFIAEELVSRGADRDKIRVVPCGVDVGAFDVARPEPGANLLFVGRLVEKKGLADLLGVLAEQPGLPPLDVVGDGPLREPLERFSRDRRLSVTFHGTQPSSRVRELMQAASVVVMPSRRAADGDTEGLPVTSLEAAASARPVVGYAHSGLVDSVLTGATGVLVPEGDTEALGRELSALIADPDRVERLGRAGRRHVEENFTSVSTLARVEDVYDEARGVRGGD